MEETQDCVPSKAARRTFVSFALAGFVEQPLGLRNEPNDRQMSLEDTRCYRKNKVSGMKNALVYSEILTSPRVVHKVRRGTFT
jgi:hypothetical protein